MESLGVSLHRLELFDLKQAMGLEKACYSSPWTTANMVSELNREVGFNLGLFRERHLIAMSICWLIAPECHLLNLAVHPGLRRQGLGRQLLRAICLLAIKFGAKFFHLEVSVSNRPAQALYKSAGFRNVGYRPNYYPEGTDAILMTLDLLNIYGPQSGQQIS